MKISRLTLFIFGLLWLPAALGQSLKLPFFDDFSTARQTPSASRWVGGSGVYVNNTMTSNHPTVNVATFDGLRSSGLPYALSDENAEGGTDTLTSLPIDLSGLTAASGVYLSFFWQRRGLGEQPDATDSLLLDVKGTDGRWRQVWGRAGNVVDNNFATQLIAITNSLDFTPNFQFRFRSVGRQSGMFDAWHLDYIYLNKGRTAVYRPLRDRALVQPVSPLLRRYTAMPLRQFLARPTTELADSIRSDFRNLDVSFIPINTRFTVRDDLTGRVLQQDTLPNPINALGLSRYPLAFRLRLPLPAATQQRAVFRSTYSLITKDDSSPDVPELNLTLNDTLSAVTVLDDYYAYDDGSAETVKQINQRLARVAVRFVTHQPDAVKAVRINIAPSRRDQRGQPILVGIYGNNNGQPTDRPIVQQSFPIAYPQERNGFVDFLFDTPVNVPDSVFYVAYSQLDDPAIPIGYDRNSPFRNLIFVNLATRWDRLTDQDGVLMIRPVMNGGPVVLTATEPEPPALVFPNPTAGRINWSGALANATYLEVVSAGGQTLLTLPLAAGQTTADLGTLPTGFYLLRFTTSRGTYHTVKLLLSQ